MYKMVETIKTAAIDAVNASNPVAVIFGTVVSILPLKVNIEQRFTLDDSHLILSSAVRDHQLEVTVDHSTQIESGHSHQVTGKKTITVHNGLKIGEKVIMMRVQGGQKYVILDRVVM